MLLLEALKRFANALYVEDRSPRTVRFYSDWLKQFDQSLMFHELELLTVEHMRQWLAGLKDRDLKPTSRRGAAMTLKIFFKWCTDESLIEHNPAARLKLPKKEKRIPTALTTPDVIAIINDAKAYSKHPRRDVALICFFTQSGCRLSEIADLPPDQLHIEDGFALVIGKGNKQRPVFFGDATKIAMRLWLSERPTEASTVFDLTPSGIQQILRRLKNRTGLKFSAHKFRRTTATLRAYDGSEAILLKSIMGWESVDQANDYVEQARLMAAAPAGVPIDAELQAAMAR